VRPHQFRSRSTSPAQWRLTRQIQAILAVESGASFEELAERTGGTFADVRTAARALYRMRHADFRWSFLTAVPSADEGRREA
jgi:transcription initiation factor IIE alpha subunit